MRVRDVLGLVAVVAVTMTVVISAEAQQRRRGGGGEFWDNLGCAEIGRRTDVDVIQVGRREGFFKAIRLEVSRRDVFINDLRVVYGNGEPDRLAVNASLRSGQQSRALDLVGWARAIDRIEIVARKAAGEDRGRAEVCVFGLEATRDEISRFQQARRGDDRGRDERGRGERREWVELGCERAGFVNDRDVINVGRREGRFRALRLGVQGADVRISDMRVVFGDGTADHVAIDQWIDGGEFTRPLDLAGDRRAIDRIELVYHSRLNLRGPARVCVFGHE